VSTVRSRRDRKIMTVPKVYQYVAGGDPRFVPYKPRVRVSDDELEALRMIYDGSNKSRSHGKIVPGGGLRALAKIVGCSDHGVRYRLRKIAEREEGV